MIGGALYQSRPGPVPPAVPLLSPWPDRGKGKNGTAVRQARGMALQVRARTKETTPNPVPLSRFLKKRRNINMIKPVQKAGQGRYGAGTRVPVPSVPSNRQPGERAVLVSERSAVWDRAATPATPERPIEAIADPIWDHADGRRWTPDLVHCRLLAVGSTIARLPSPLRRGFVSLLADAALDHGREIRRPPTAAEISLADWTWAELLKRPDTQRAILQAMACGASVRKVAELLARRGWNVKKSTVGSWYINERRYLAARWQEQKHPVDRESFDRWQAIFESQK